MKRNNFWKWIFLALVIAWSVNSFYPIKARPLIETFTEEATGKDAAFAEIIKRAEALQAKLPERSFKNLQEAIGTNDIRKYFPGINLKEEKKDPTYAILNKVQRKGAGKVKLGLDLQGGTSFLVGIDTNQIAQSIDSTNQLLHAEHRDRALSQAAEVLRKRVDRFGVAEPIIQPAGDDRILIQLPGLSEADMNAARGQIERAAFLEFRLVHPESRRLITEGVIEPGYEVLVSSDKHAEPYLVEKRSKYRLTGKSIKRAYVTREMVSNRPEVGIDFDSEGGEIFGRLTSENVKRQLAIVLDGELMSAPVINTAILGGHAVITGDYTAKDAYNLASILENPLETPVKIIESRQVDPSLGKDSISSGVRASIYGTLAVAVFMLVYYLFSGIVAIIALVLNLVILLGVMCSIGTTLTLPGIAGIVLTVGMAVDANVLIFERIREELAAGKSIRGAINAGYDKAFGTIFDSNLTTLISSVILIFMGTGPVKGFGVTLTIGVCVSMFTALVVTRMFFDWLLARNKVRSLRMLQFISGSNINFLKWAKPAFIASWLLIGIGIGYGIHRGTGALGVDFRGGDQITLAFGKRVDADDLRKSISKLAVGDPMIQFQKDIATGSETLRVTTAFETGPKVFESISQAFPDAKFKLLALDRVGGVVGKEIQKSAVLASFLALFGILVYVAFRYEFSFAVGAVVAVIHDVLMTMGWFFLTGREMSAPMVAAVLTIIGFSINDTIVIFDRIREDLKMGVRGSFMEVINKALNQTLSRTIITSGTVFLATMSLYLFGGGVINDFAFTFLIGILTGTYSSIYIASALVLWWHKGERPKLASPVSQAVPGTARS